ncbi:MAG: peptidoglycan DD-metalloendopeptidase family protein [Candidatus Binatia bacterium]
MDLRAASYTPQVTGYILDAQIDFFVDFISEKSYQVENFLAMIALRGTAAFFLGVALILLWLVTPIHPSGATSLKQPAKNGANENKPKLPAIESLDSTEHVTLRIQRGDTLAKLLRPYGLSGREREFWFRSIRRHYSTRRLRPGKEIHFYFTKNRSVHPGENPEGHLKALEIELNEDWVLTWERGSQGIVFRKRERPYEIEVKTFSATITDSLYEDGVRSGVPPTVIAQFVDIFAWNVNFHADIREGDSFRILLKRKYRKGSKGKETFRILAAELINRGQKHFAFYFQNGNGKGGYYDLEGRSLTRAFLPYPLEFSRISSTVSHGRFHPILKVKRPHRGVDFAAKRGTPVRAVSNGKVTYAGWKKGGYGRFIEIQHGSTFKTRYAHLGGISRGIRRGAKVRKGQIIGYVGCSGSCTGPHLHFELYKNQKYVNPFRVKLFLGDRVTPARRKNFDKAKRLFLTELAASKRS